jgi:hypothetical protein
VNVFKRARRNRELRVTERQHRATGTRTSCAAFQCAAPPFCFFYVVGAWQTSSRTSADSAVSFPKEAGTQTQMSDVTQQAT